MPQLRDITVRVTDGDGHDLEEWGVRTIHGKKLVSAYIQSTTDMPFRISVRPQIPYVDGQQRSEHSRPGQSQKSADGVYIKEEPVDEDMDQIALHSRPGPHDSYIPSHSSHRRRSAGGDDDAHLSRRQSDSNGHPASSPLYKRKASYDAPPPFRFLATLYLDGRQKPERRIIVYLDPSDDDFNYPDGKVTFKCRCVQGRDGRLKEQAWVFKDIGVEAVFNRIALSDRTKDVRDPEDLLVDALNTSRLGDEYIEATEEQGKIGQIVVELKRVWLGKKFNEPDYRAKHQEGDKDDVDMEEMGQDVAHKSAHKHLRTLPPQATRCIEFEEYQREEGVSATFQFFYRSQERLERFGFPGFPQIIRAGKNLPRGGRHLDTKLANLTPLSIAHSSQHAPVFAKRTKDTFEEKVRQGRGDVKKSKWNFLDYRDPPDDVPAMTDEEASKNTKESTVNHVNDGVDKKRNNRTPYKGTLSNVVTVKERARPRPQATFTTGTSRSGSSSPLPDDSPADPLHAPSVEPPANSPTTGFYNPLADPRLSAPKGSTLDIFKTLSDASLVLAKQTDSTRERLLTPKSSLKDTEYRQTNYPSDADDEKDAWVDTGPSNVDDDESGESDKENMPSMDANDAGLHEKLKAVSIGSKRQRGEGTEELEEGELDEGEERQIKKSTSPRVRSGSGIVPEVETKFELMIEEEKEAASLQSETAAGKGKYQAKRVKA